jgi:hypothetical protein
MRLFGQLLLLNKQKVPFLYKTTSKGRCTRPAVLGTAPQKMGTRTQNFRHGTSVF